MKKMLRCRDVGMDCDFVMRGKDEDDVMRQAERHAKEKHGMTAVPPDVAKKARAAIKDQPLP